MMVQKIGLDDARIKSEYVPPWPPSWTAPARTRRHGSCELTKYTSPELLCQQPAYTNTKRTLSHSSLETLGEQPEVRRLWKSRGAEEQVKEKRAQPDPRGGGLSGKPLYGPPTLWTLLTRVPRGPNQALGLGCWVLGRTVPPNPQHPIPNTY